MMMTMMRDKTGFKKLTLHPVFSAKLASHTGNTRQLQSDFSVISFRTNSVVSKLSELTICCINQCTSHIILFLFLLTSTSDSLFVPCSSRDPLMTVRTTSYRIHTHSETEEISKPIKITRLHHSLTMSVDDRICTAQFHDLQTLISATYKYNKLKITHETLIRLGWV